MRLSNTLLSFLTVAVAGGYACAADSTTPDTNPVSGQNSSTAQPPAADNSAVNARDQGNHSLTPPDQATITTGDSAADTKQLATIRNNVVADKDLSVDAKNVKIYVKDGVVTLRGPVQNDGEKKAIEQIAVQVPGVTKVDDQLDCLVK